MSRKRKNNTGIPDFEIDSLARALLPAIQKLFESEEGKREFEEWQAERQKSQLNKNKIKNLVDHIEITADLNKRKIVKCI